MTDAQFENAREIARGNLPDDILEMGDRLRDHLKRNTIPSILPGGGGGLGLTEFDIAEWVFEQVAALLQEDTDAGQALRERLNLQDYNFRRRVALSPNQQEFEITITDTSRDPGWRGW